MATPKTVTKVIKNSGGQVEFTSDCDQAQYFIHELTRAALRDVGKFLKSEFRSSYYSHFKRRTGTAGKATSVKVWSSKNTKYPRLEIGLKQGKQDGFYAYFQEFGTKTGNVPRLGLLQHAAKDNISTIIEIESKYLSGLNGEAASLKSQVNEGEYNDDGE